jgi:hypothetical protein
VTDQPGARFAVAAYGTWPALQKAVQELGSAAKPLTEISCLALRSVLVDGPEQPFHDLAFSANAQAFACTPGPIAERLAARLAAGVPSLQAALGTWLIPRHAAQLKNMAEKGKIVMWVRLHDSEDEQCAYRALLATGCNSVGVHDLVGS